MTYNIKWGLCGAALIAVLSFSGTAEAGCFSQAVMTPKDLAPYISMGQKTKAFESADQATKDRVDQYLKDAAEVSRLGQEHCDLMSNLYKNDQAKKAIFEKWGDPNVNGAIITEFDPYIRADLCKK